MTQTAQNYRNRLRKAMKIGTRVRNTFNHAEGEIIDLSSCYVTVLYDSGIAVTKSYDYFVPVK